MGNVVVELAHIILYGLSASCEIWRVGISSMTCRYIARGLDDTTDGLRVSRRHYIIICNTVYVSFHLTSSQREGSQTHSHISDTCSIEVGLTCRMSERSKQISSYSGLTKQISLFVCVSERPR